MFSVVVGTISVEKPFALCSPGMNEYFYNKCILFAVKMKKKGLHGEDRLVLSLESSVDGLRGERRIPDQEHSTSKGTEVGEP